MTKVIIRFDIAAVSERAVTGSVGKSQCRYYIAIDILMFSNILNLKTNPIIKTFNILALNFNPLH